MNVPLVAVLGISPTEIANALISAVTHWLEAGAAGIVTGVGTAIETTTSVRFDTPFLSLYDELRLFGVVLLVPMLGAATIHAVVRSDGAALVRMLTIRIPVALIGSGAAIWVVRQSLGLSDAFASALLFNQGGGAADFSDNLVAFVSGGSSLLDGFVGAILAIFTAVVALLLWVELEVRACAVLCATLFIPLALAGVIWPATDHWIRRLAETIGALILSKVAIVAILVLGIEMLGASTGVAGSVEGLSVLTLATFAPLGLLRLIPMIEHGAGGSLDGVSHRMNRAMGGAAIEGARKVSAVSERSSTESDSDSIPWAQSEPVDQRPFDEIYREVLANIDAADRRRSGGSS